MNANKTLWEMDLGSGATALPAAKLGAEVLGVDIARNLVEAGNRRAREEGLENLRFQVHSSRGRSVATPLVMAPIAPPRPPSGQRPG